MKKDTNVRMRKKKTTEQFNREAQNIHYVSDEKGNKVPKYDYSNTIYSNCRGKVNIKCKKHGLFTQNASNHLNGQGCPMCGKSRNKSKAADWIEIQLSKVGIRYETEKECSDLYNKTSTH